MKKVVMVLLLSTAVFMQSCKKENEVKLKKLNTADVVADGGDPESESGDEGKPKLPPHG